MSSQAAGDMTKRGRDAEHEQAAAAASEQPQQKRARARSNVEQPPQSQSVTRLADVEVQLVMRLPDLDTRLKFARCSRQLLHAARHRFAWPDTLLFTITEAHLYERHRRHGRCVLPGCAHKLRKYAALLQASLLRFTPIRVEWDTSSDISVAALRCVSNLRAVRSAGSLVDASLWRMLLRCSLTQRLWEVDYQADTTVSWHPGKSGPLQRLAELRMLRVQLFSICSFAPVFHAPNLTQLNCGFVYAPRKLHSPQLTAIAQLPRVRHLTLSDAHFNPGELYSLLHGADLCHTLEYLCLHHACFADPDLIEDAGAFAALTQLHTIELTPIDDIAPCLAMLVDAPSLQQLAMQINYENAMEVPVDALQTLVQTMPQLHARVRFARVLGCGDDCSICASHDADVDELATFSTRLVCSKEHERV